MNNPITPNSYYKSANWWLPGAVAIIVLLLLIGLPVVALIGRVGELHFTELLGNTYIRNVVWFSLWQATLSTILAVGLAIPVAFSLARQSDFPGRAWLIRLFSISLIIPTVVAVFGIIAVYGNNGWLNQILAASGLLTGFSIYGISGILIAHVFFNLPLSARIMLHALEKIPAENWRLASQLDITSFNSLRLIQWPLIRSALPGIALLVFSLCFTSFAIVMTLGGGPGATTIEVAIYQALRFEFDLNSAVGLAFIQTGMCLVLILFNARYGRAPEITRSRGNSYQRRDGETNAARFFDFTMITLASLLVCLPFAAIFWSGLNSAMIQVLGDYGFWKAASNTLIVSLCAGSLAVLLACGLLISSVHLRTRLGQHFSGRLVELSGSFILVIPPLVLGTGLFLLLRDFTDVFALALLLTVLINALMGLPFAIRVLENPMLNSALANDQLCASLGIRGIDRLRVIDWPLLRKPIGLALAFSSTLAAGDLTVIALFGSQDVTTLPLLLYQKMSSYRLQEAAVTALLLLVFCLLLFWLLEILIGGRRLSGEIHARA